MKRLFIVLALVASLQVSNAQVKSPSAAKTAVESAQKAADDAKKNTKSATWIKLGQTLVDAYDAARGSGWIGANRQELDLVMGVKPLTEEDATVAGRTMKKVSYPTMDYYFSEAGELQIIDITKPVYPDALERAAAAFKKAAELDPKGQKTEDIKAALESVVSKLNDEAYAAYSFGDYAKASMFFEKAGDASALVPFVELNTQSIYNAAFTAFMVGDYDRAKTFFTKSIDNKYEGEDGEAYAKLADILDKQGDKEGAKNILEEAFVKYPSSQSILIGLINYYLSEEGGNTSRLFELLELAKKNEPDNASLYYVEGNIHKQLGEEEAAIAAYDKCTEINPAYEYGLCGKGIYFYEKAVKIQEEADKEMDDKKWEALNVEFEKALKNCIEPFEKAFEITKDESLKVNIAEYLKNACFRFRTESQEYMDKYEKYNAASSK